MFNKFVSSNLANIFIQVNDTRVKETILQKEMDVIAGALNWMNTAVLSQYRKDIPIKMADGEQLMFTTVVNFLPKPMTNLVTPAWISISGTTESDECNLKISYFEGDFGDCPYTRAQIVGACRKLCKWTGKNYADSSWQISKGITNVNLMNGEGYAHDKSSIPVVVSIGSLYAEEGYLFESVNLMENVVIPKALTLE